MSSMNLVTGATGFIGRVLCEQLQKEGVRVTGCGRKSMEGPWQTFAQVDLASPTASLNLDGIDAVFHLASKAHALAENAQSIQEYHDVIVCGTKRVIDAAEKAGIRKLVYVSSVKAMGEGHSVGNSLSPISEQCNSVPKTPYGEAKLEAERLVLNSKIPHVSVIRPVMVYGPGHKGNLVRMAEAIRKGRFPPIRDSGNRRSMVHVEDLIAACIKASREVAANREVFIIAGNRSISTRELYDRLRIELGMRPVEWSVPDVALQSCAMLGDLLGRVLGRRMPLDRDTLSKLTDSAWYSNDKSKDLLSMDYINDERPYLEDVYHQE